MNWVLFIIALLVMLFGLVGTILPVIPGITLIFGAALAYGFLTDFSAISVNMLMLFAVMTIVTYLSDWIATTYGVKKMGGSWYGTVGAVIGTIVGISGGIVGILLGVFIGAFLFELLGGKSHQTALRAGAGSMIGFVIGGVFKIAVGVAIIVVFVWKVVSLS